MYHIIIDAIFYYGFFIALMIKQKVPKKLIYAYYSAFAIIIAVCNGISILTGIKNIKYYSLLLLNLFLLILILIYLFKSSSKDFNFMLVCLGIGFFLTINAYARVYYYFSSNFNFDKDFSYMDALYYSVTTITTAGYGDIHPIHCIGQILASSEMLVGYFFGSILVALAISKLFDLKNSKK